MTTTSMATSNSASPFAVTSSTIATKTSDLINTKNDAIKNNKLLSTSGNKRLNTASFNIDKTSKTFSPNSQVKKANKTSFPSLQHSKKPTPPYKNFRKLRLFDTPHTPKTLIKKSNLLISQKINDSTPSVRSPSVVQDNKKTKISKITNSIKKKDQCLETTEATIQPLKIEIKFQMENEEKHEPQSPISQTTKSSSIKEQLFHNVHLTPKSSKRTPANLLLKAPIPTIGLSVSPCHIDSVMEIDDNVSKSDFNKSPFNNNHSNRRLFEQNILSFKNNMNKKLQFDDSDNDESSSSCCSNYGSEFLNKKLLTSNRPFSTDSTFEKTSQLSTSSSALSFQTTEIINGNLTSLDSHRSLNNFGCQNLNQLSYSSNSLFKPISRFSNPYFNSMSSNNLYCTSYNSVTSTSSNCSGSTRSPKSPFQFNHLQANINPFTPTNSYNSGNIITNRLKTELGSSSTSLPGLNDNLFNNKTNETNSVFIKQQHTSFKRGLSQTINKENQEDEIAQNEQEESAYSNNNMQPKNQTNESNDLQNSLPKNKRLALRQCLVSRYHEEFHEVCRLGSGEFGDVFKCINRLDGCTYAIKRSKKPIAGSALEIAAWKEVCAHAVLVKHNHIVQYYSAWAEADRMLIQNEYCNGGSLAEFIETLKINNLSSSEMTSLKSPIHSDGDNNRIISMQEYDLKTLLLHVAKGLAYMHSLNLVHLDIKPGNIFICRSPRRINQNQLDTDSVSSQSSVTSGVIINEESGIESDELDEDFDYSTSNATSSKTDDNKIKSKNNTKASIFSEIITYKIGDLGHVTSTLDPHVEEGDCRYLPNEILQEQYDYLNKADVFALALTVFVCVSVKLVLLFRLRAWSCLSMASFDIFNFLTGFMKSS